MHILIEEYQYPYEVISNTFHGLEVLKDIDGKTSLSYVGYFFNPQLPDCVFILPKVLLEGPRGQEKVFGHIDPVDLIHFERCKELKPQEREFIYNLSVWIYRAICVYKQHERDARRGQPDRPSLVLHQQAPMVGHLRRKKTNTFLDILLALVQWNRENQQFVMFVTKNIHSGHNKINWTRTIAKSQAFIQDGTPIYLNPVNKKRQINFDEELLVIYYSILAHLHDAYGFPVSVNVNFPIIKGTKFKHYIDGYGLRRLKQIKYKYFSDKALELWELCKAFFERPEEANITVDRKEYLLVKSFPTVFEAIIDELVAGDQRLPAALVDQEDGKRVDHMYQYQELTNNEKDESIYYIGDSKYYKRNNKLGPEAVYKQYTYARNVIQWNIDLFNDDSRKEEREGHSMLRDEVTEGYNVIPNFFISANQDSLEAVDDIKLIDCDKPEGQRRQQYYMSRQFVNRLFDRDTFLLAHYDVNFLFVVALYGRNNASSKNHWREKVRYLFRKECQEMLEKNYTFYAITAHGDVNPEQYIESNYRTVIGKLFHPFDDHPGTGQQYYSLALRNPDCEEDQAVKARVADENDRVLFQLKDAFYVVPCTLGANPQGLLPEVEPTPRVVPQAAFLTQHHVENYREDWFLVGGFNMAKQLDFLYGRKGGKRDDAYNVRLGKEEHGGIVKSRDNVKHAKFVILYEYGKENEGVWKVFRVKNTGELTKQQMEEYEYHNPTRDSYFCYFFDEEVTLGSFDIEQIILADQEAFAHDSTPGEAYPTGRPIYLKGEELLKYRK